MKKMNNSSEQLSRPSSYYLDHKAIVEAESSDESPELQFDPWDRKSLQRAQLNDVDIFFIYELVLNPADRPSWSRMPSKS